MPQVLMAVVAAQGLLILWLIYEHRRRHLAEMRSRNSIAELNRMDRAARTELLSVAMVHELKQPLVGIGMIAAAGLRWLRGERPDFDKVENSLRRIEECCSHTADVITSIRAMFNKDRDGDKQPVVINRVIRSVLATAQIDLRRKGVAPQTQLDEKLPLVEGDEGQLQLLIMNLVTNAVESMQSSRLRVLQVKSGRSKSDAVHVSVEDTGPGIDPDKISEIFSPQFTIKPGEMAMGLSICRAIVEKHGGRIWASRGIEGGSIFQFELPIKSDGAEAGPAGLALPRRWSESCQPI
jgi:signal transduction histidine kinase